MDYGVTEPEDAPKPSEQDNIEKTVKPTGNETKKDNLPPPPLLLQQLHYKNKRAL